MGGSTIYANRDVSFSVEKGELAIILGSSGAGKSTVLNILGGMDSNDSGKVIIDGKDISKYSRTQLTAYRRTDVGFVFQFYNLVQNLTAKENVELASEIVEHALDPVTVLKDVGLADRINNFPAQLSGGEQQRCTAAAADRACREGCGDSGRCRDLGTEHPGAGRADRCAGISPFRQTGAANSPGHEPTKGCDCHYRHPQCGDRTHCRPGHPYARCTGQPH